MPTVLGLVLDVGTMEAIMGLREFHGGFTMGICTDGVMGCRTYGSFMQVFCRSYSGFMMVLQGLRVGPNPGSRGPEPGFGPDVVRFGCFWRGLHQT